MNHVELLSFRVGIRSAANIRCLPRGRAKRPPLLRTPKMEGFSKSVTGIGGRSLQSATAGMR